MTRHRRPMRPDALPGLRNIATAAAAASGVLSVVTPIAGSDLGDAATESTGAFRLAAEAAAATPSSSTTRTGPVLAGADDVVATSGLLSATSRAGDEADRARTAREAATRTPAPVPAPAGEESRRDAPSSASCDLDLGDLGGVKSWVSDAAQFLGCAFGQPDMLGVGSRGNASDHPSGKALDFMTSDRAQGDAIAECALANADELGVTYVIWRQRMNSGSGWETMEDRGGETANHFDHVHISFDGDGGSGTPDLGRCA